MQAANEPLETGHAASAAAATNTDIAPAVVVDFPARTGEPPARWSLFAAFRKLGRGSDAPTAHERMMNFYRAGGHEWTRAFRGRS